MDPKDLAATATTIADDKNTPIAADPGALDSLELEGARYGAIALLGRGGMGEVQLCRDKLVGREIARKTILPESRNGASLARFIREAKIQARLEHPAIVPVYDIGRDDDGAIWFTMKRVRGRSLEQVLGALAAGDEQTAAELSRRKLLAAFVAVCYAMAYAHEHGVVHRDLKPGNIMLGRFGEVSVLDWGIAKVSGVADPLADEVLSDLAPRVHATEQGTAVGTPGYMAPEQARGESDVGPAADVYALGAILFEILALERLHQGTSGFSIMLATLREVDARPSSRGADVPLELDEICVRATRLDPAARFQSARELAEAVDRYLDGDRDLERRRELAQEHTDKAVAARDRGTAMLELARALALDPSNARARDLMAERIITIGDEVPPEAREELEIEHARARRTASRSGARRYVTWCAFAPLLFWMGIRNETLDYVALALLLATNAWAWSMTRRMQRDSSALMILLALSSLTIAVISGLFGAFILVPALAATNAMYFAMTLERKHRVWASLASIAAIGAPFALEAMHVIAPTYDFGASLVTFTVHARGCYFRPVPTQAMLLFTSIAMAVIPVLLISRMRDALTRAEQRLFLQAWQLRATLPEETQARLAARRTQ